MTLKRCIHSRRLIGQWTCFTKKAAVQTKDCSEELQQLELWLVWDYTSSHLSKTFREITDFGSICCSILPKTGNLRSKSGGLHLIKRTVTVTDFSYFRKCMSIHTFFLSTSKISCTNILRSIPGCLWLFLHLLQILKVSGWELCLGLL